MAGLLALLAPAVVVVVLLVVADVVVVFWEGKAAAVTGLGCVGVSVELPRVPGDDCTLSGLVHETSAAKL